MSVRSLMRPSSLKIRPDPVSYKRFFINNLDSYHGRYILKEIGKILAKEAMELQAMVPETLMIPGEDDDSVSPPPRIQPYEIYGTVIDPEKIKSLDNVTKVLKQEQCFSEMLTCGIVILDISYDNEQVPFVLEYLDLLMQLLDAEVGKEMQDDVQDNDNPPPPTIADLPKRSLVLISSPMTWAFTKPLDPDEPEMAFVETDFRKRRPHPNYKQHYNCENKVIEIARKYKSLIGAIVITTGLTYGGQEDVLFYWFQKAWECEPILPIFGRGSNAVPLINVADLALIVYNLVTNFPKKLFILAVEQNFSKQREIIKAIGKTLGTGMFKCIPPENALLIPEVTQRMFELMTLNLYMEPTFIVETMNLQWASELTFTENVLAISKQFTHERRLKPFKVLIYGPPLVGKTTLAKRICYNYGLVYISPTTVVNDLIEDLSWRVQHWEKGEFADLIEPSIGEGDAVPDDDEPEAEDEEAKESARNTLAILQSGKQPTEEEMIMYLRKRLLCQEAKNKGWVLDGFPTTLTECTQLFEKGEDTASVAEETLPENEPFDEDVDLYTNVVRRLLPDIVVSLEATDEFVCEKAIHIPENYPYVSEENIIRRLRRFRNGDTLENTPLNFFDELDIHPLVVPMVDYKDYEMEQAYKEVSLRMGQPCKYEKILAQIREAEAKAQKEREILRCKQEKAMLAVQRKIQEEHDERMKYWSELYSMMREEEEAALAVAGEQMRNYLMKHIFPTLTPALLELAKTRPHDPIDFLAEYLFKKNPTGKMLEPGYNLQAEKLLGKIKILDEAMQDLEIQIDPLLPPEADDDPENKEKDKYTLRDMSSF